MSKAKKFRALDRIRKAHAEMTEAIRLLEGDATLAPMVVAAATQVEYTARFVDEELRDRLVGKRK